MSESDECLPPEAVAVTALIDEIRRIVEFHVREYDMHHAGWHWMPGYGQYDWVGMYWRPGRTRWLRRPSPSRRRIERRLRYEQ